MYRASDYTTAKADGTTETGACVMIGDDTVVDLPFNAGWSEETQRRRAVVFAAALNSEENKP